MPRPSARPLAALSLVAILASVGGGCTSGDPARTGAERFLDRYYVEIDLPAAREESVGVARAKIDHEMELLRGIAAPESGAKPTVHYRFVKQHDGATVQRQGFVYELTISLTGGPQILRRALVTVQQEGADWRTANFEELD
ncbi:MAG: hypothetical protein FJ144_23735 [Deltaproteobacteria bacterium]|nr:hypothetical protein [Deltaproteobacteria bacterium]